jgi:hypothetical protein
MKDEDLNFFLNPLDINYLNSKYNGYIEQYLPTELRLQAYNILLRSKMSQELKEERDKKTHMVDIAQ